VLLALSCSWADGADEAVADTHAEVDCKCWAAQDQCTSNADFMLKSCAKSCERHMAQLATAAETQAKLRETEVELGKKDDRASVALAKAVSEAESRCSACGEEMSEADKDLLAKAADTQAKLQAAEAELKTKDDVAAVGLAQAVNEAKAGCNRSDQAAPEADQALAERAAVAEAKLREAEAELKIKDDVAAAALAKAVDDAKSRCAASNAAEEAKQECAEKMEKQAQAAARHQETISKKCKGDLHAKSSEHQEAESAMGECA